MGPLVLQSLEALYVSNAIAEAKLSYTSFSSCVSMDENNLKMLHKYLVKLTAISGRPRMFSEIVYCVLHFSPGPFYLCEY
jgi:hypothetical protein